MDGGPTRAPKRSQLDDLLQPTAFLWATGIEDTFVFNPHAVTGRILDEYELTKHYERWREDLDLMGSLGVPAARYGIPWYKLSPDRGKWDWSFADAALERMLDLGIDPIVDLIHYGAPKWLEGAFLHPDFPQYMEEYAVAVAERYKGRIRWYTPLNEPRITAHYCGRIGWWPPNRFGWRGFSEVMMSCAKGIVLADRAIHAVDPENVVLHVDATETYDTGDPTMEPQVEFRRDLIYLATDLVTGRVEPGHRLFDWLRKNGIRESQLEWLSQHSIEPDVLGVNLYPMFSRREVFRGPNLTRFKARYGDRTLVKRICEGFWERYRRPVMISETASQGTIQRRSKWLAESLEGVRELRQAGVPVVGYTWWPMFSLVTWAYRQKMGPLSNYVVPMGLWDLRGDDLERVESCVVQEYRRAIAAGHRSVGELRREVPIGVS
ncbi:glycoside hydrolase family 1 [Fimbriimonas ginsengisoli Gsoil 348]|uniref:Glycoside hydrolase family 1 n=2 Tax=Fimbriimonas ginsengisoli TaxID=1005039 RepID=A0A068NRN1_FIMGI|nr:glycoside hydrolase family 1 [Fimbriimonas ginsengisoli Gsoil 348]